MIKKMVIPIGIMKFFVFFIDQNSIRTFLLCLKRKKLISYKNGKELEKYRIFGYLLESCGAGYWSKNTMWQYIEKEIKSSVEELRLLKYKGMKYNDILSIFKFGNDFSYDLWRFATGKCMVFHPKFTWRTGEGNSIKFSILSDPLIIILHQNISEKIPNGDISSSILLKEFPFLSGYILDARYEYNVRIERDRNREKTILYLPEDYSISALWFCLKFASRCEINKNDFKLR